MNRAPEPDPLQPSNPDFAQFADSLLTALAAKLGIPNGILDPDGSLDSKPGEMTHEAARRREGRKAGTRQADGS